MVHDAIVVHHIHGKLRLGLPDSNRNQQSLAELRDFIAGPRAVHSVQVNPTTGSILGHYERDSHGEMQAAFGDQPEPPSFAGGGLTRLGGLPKTAVLNGGSASQDIPMGGDHVN
jgi:hypothetical protein